MITNLELSQPQYKFFSDKSRLVLGLAGRGGGKTWVLCLKALNTMLEYPKSLSVFAASNPAQLTTVVVKAFTDLCDQCGIQWVVGSSPPWFESSLTSHTNVLSLENGSQALLRSYFESGADRNLRGISCQAIFIDEAREIDETIFDVLAACLRGGTGPWTINATSTPAGKDWMYRRFADEKTKTPNSVLHRWITQDNAHNLPPNFIEDLKAQMSVDLFRQEVLGEFVDLGRGARVYRFEKERHLKDYEYDPTKWYLAWSMDYNVAPLIGLVVCVNDKTRCMHVVDEFVMKDNGKTDVICEHFASKWRRVSSHISFMGDESGGHRDTRQTESDLVIMKNVMTRYFPSTRNLNGSSKPFVQDRIAAVNSMLDPAVGEPRLTIHPRCKTLIEDLEQVVYCEDGSRKIDKSDSRYTHATDALGYLAERLFGLKRSGLVQVGY